MVTFAGAIVDEAAPGLVGRPTHDPVLTRLFADVQAVFGMNEVGLRDASRAASRAASLTLICE